MNLSLDFILLAESGLLVVAATGLGVLARGDASWRWLALFLLAQAGVDWVAIAALGPLAGNLLQLAQTSLQVLAVVALFEFARRHRFLLHAPARRRIYAGVAAIAAGILAVAGTATLNPLIAIAAGVSGTWASLWMFRCAQVSVADKARRLRLIGLALPLYAVVAALPESQRSVLDGFGLGETGPALIELVIAALLTVPLSIDCAVAEQHGMTAAGKRSWRRRRYFAAAVVAALVAAGVFVADRAGQAKDRAMREQILLRAQLAAASLDANAVRTLQWSDADLTSDAYARLKERITAIRAANPDLRFAMLMGFEPGRAHFLVDSEPPESEDYSPPGQLYEEAEPAYLDRLTERQPFVLGPIRDRWGMWITGSVPLVELGPGRGVNFDLDIAATHWSAAIREARQPVTFIVLLVSLLVLGSFVAQERLRESAQRLEHARDTAEAATRAKSDFLAVMSHELRTPLAGVIGMLDLLRGKPPAHLREQYIMVARDSAETLLRLLDDILDTAKIEAGKLRIERVPFRPREEFKPLCEAARLRATAKKVEFTYTFARAMPEVLLGDPVRLRQVVGNLQNNALKFTDSGSIHVTFACPEVRPESVVLLIAVRDTGCGIDEATRGRLFEKFEQADVSTTRRYGGTGLGLSIVKALAEAMNGTVSVESEPGRGSTFTFVAPLGRPGSDVAVPTTAETFEISRSPVRLRVLCAEDDRANRLVAEALLTQMGHDVTLVENGALAIERLRTQPFDVVLMDGRMPVLDGMRATQLIRDPATGVLDPEIYICAATANASAASQQHVLAHGMNDYIAKPLTHTRLEAALARAIEHLRARGLTLRKNEPACAKAPPTGMSEAELLSLLDESAATATRADTPALPESTMQELRGIFHQETPPRLAALRDACGRADAAEIAGIAHTLKSAARYVGATRLSELAAALERDAGTVPAPALAGAIAELAEEYRRMSHGCRPEQAAPPTP